MRDVKDKFNLHLSPLILEDVLSCSDDGARILEELKIAKQDKILADAATAGRASRTAVIFLTLLPVSLVNNQNFIKLFNFYLYLSLMYSPQPAD